MHSQLATNAGRQKANAREMGVKGKSARVALKLERVCSNIV
jgi:hypothetical protein